MSTPASQTEGRSLATRLFSFPNPVNEVSARLVAGGVVIMGLVIVTFDVYWLLVLLTYGFLARVLTGPTMSPLGQLVTRAVTPRLHIAPRFVAGPPKRLAQGIGLIFSAMALVLASLDDWTPAKVVLALLIVAATLESVVGLCLGCKVFAFLMRGGVIPAEVCDRCNNWSPVTQPNES